MLLSIFIIVPAIVAVDDNKHNPAILKSKTAGTVFRNFFTILVMWVFLGISQILFFPYMYNLLD